VDCFGSAVEDRSYSDLVLAGDSADIVSVVIVVDAADMGLAVVA
jgi:hypothetical protein